MKSMGANWSLAESCPLQQSPTSLGLPLCFWVIPSWEDPPITRTDSPQAHKGRAELLGSGPAVADQGRATMG